LNDLRHLPSVDKLLAQASPLIEAHGRSLTTDAVRAVLDEARASIRAGGAPPDQAQLLSRIADRLREWTAYRPRAVINATGVIIHQPRPCAVIG
jgi:L-seryl-tRNA(Ser) seleniumtransferase